MRIRLLSKTKQKKEQELSFTHIIYRPLVLFYNYKFFIFQPLIMIWYLFHFSLMQTVGNASFMWEKTILLVYAILRYKWMLWSKVGKLNYMNALIILQPAKTHAVNLKLTVLLHNEPSSSVFWDSLFGWISVHRENSYMAFLLYECARAFSNRLNDWTWTCSTCKQKVSHLNGIRSELRGWRESQKSYRTHGSCAEIPCSHSCWERCEHLLYSLPVT